MTKALPTEIDDYRHLVDLVALLKLHNLTLRSFELLLCLRIPRTPTDIEVQINMDRMTAKKIHRQFPALIVKRTLKATGHRGRPPVIYGLTAEGVALLEAVLSLLSTEDINS
ncbi:MAG: hypothetical protein R3341_07255 [Methylophaga sp.]|nr:hypothetical protein [Methylophaga sp.]